MARARRKSLVESLVNTATGFPIAWVTTLVCMTYIPNPATCATVTVVACTVGSVARTYFINRIFVTLESKDGKVES